jgi:acyl-CoA synthetase (AMP-forming)/AMP-acid ligase II
VSELLRRGSAVAFPFEGGDEERVGVVVELERAAEGSLAEELEALAARVREAVVETHDLRVDVVAFARAGAVPKTSSGKLQRRGCREALLKNELDEIYRSAL